MSVKAVLTRSLMSGLITAKPGFHVALIRRSKRRSAKNKKKIVADPTSGVEAYTGDEQTYYPSY